MIMPVWHGDKQVAETIVDGDQVQLLRYRWTLDKEGYVQRRSSGRRIMLHSMVLGARPDGFIADHISRDKLDNRIANLRWLTYAQSAENKGPQKRNRFGLRGITYQAVVNPTNPYQAVVRQHGRNHSLSYYPTPEQAAEVSRQWRREHMPHSFEG